MCLMSIEKMGAPPSLRLSRFTEVMTACLRFILWTAWAVRRGSPQSMGGGLPCLTSQKRQERVQTSPRIRKVAVPLPQHSPMFGHIASSQTVCRLLSRIRFLMDLTESLRKALTLIHAGLRLGVVSMSWGRTLLRVACFAMAELYLRMGGKPRA